ncbi:hypothetical protein IM774_08765 [Erysipelotrichaceae bacterium RD49]|nr:hypothetical protein [Erysipelotrichaceae bacterium RD49]
MNDLTHQFHYFNHHFLSCVGLAAFVASGSFTGTPVLAADFQDVEMVDIYRLYNPNTGEHFYTADIYERDGLAANGWKDEGIGWRSSLDGDPVYRLYNPNAFGGDHYYTISTSEANGLVGQGWQLDLKGKPAFYSKGDVNVYVQYNPNARSGAHNYTTSLKEFNALLEEGWMYGQIAWKTMESGTGHSIN